MLSDAPTEPSACRGEEKGRNCNLKQSADRALADAKSIVLHHITEFDPAAQPTPFCHVISDVVPNYLPGQSQMDPTPKVWKLGVAMLSLQPRLFGASGTDGLDGTVKMARHDHEL